jgi:hypothetical protein
MAVTQTVTITKDGASFSSVDEAVALFISECASSALTANQTFNQESATSGDLIETFSVAENNDGFVVNRTWTDSKWAESESTKEGIVASNGWTKRVDVA